MTVTAQGARRRQRRVCGAGALQGMRLGSTMSLGAVALVPVVPGLAVCVVGAEQDVDGAGRGGVGDPGRSTVGAWCRSSSRSVVLSHPERSSARRGGSCCGVDAVTAPYVGRCPGDR